jgi:hypothetical protein
MTTLKFNEKSHRYWLDGKPIPGVTTIINKGWAKPFLAPWAARTVAEFVADNEDQIAALRQMGRGPMIAALKGVPWQKRDEAAVRGTDVHTIAEQVIHGEAVDVPPHLADHVEGYVRWLDAFDVRPILTEFRVANRQWWYAGTGDAIVTIGDTRWLLDWKTSADVYGETAMQTAAYRNGEFWVADDGTEQPVPEVDRLGVVHITQGGTRLHPFRDPDAAWKDFLHTQWNANARDRMDAQLLEPIEPPAQLTLVEGGAA